MLPFLFSLIIFAPCSFSSDIPSLLEEYRKEGRAALSAICLLQDSTLGLMIQLEKARSLNLEGEAIDKTKKHVEESGEVNKKFLRDEKKKVNEIYKALKAALKDDSVALKILKEIHAELLGNLDSLLLSSSPLRISEEAARSLNKGISKIEVELL